MKGIPKTPIQLYKYLLQQIPKLPVESQSYYRNYVKGVRSCFKQFFRIEFF